MRVLFCTLPQSTHFLTMAPLAWALRTAGHEVLVACPPGFVDTVTAAGITAVPVGRDPDPADNPPEAREALRRGLPEPYDLAERAPGEVPWTAARAEAYQTIVTYAYAEENTPILEDLVEFARYWRPDLVLWEPFTYAGPVAAAACGAAHGRLLFTVDVLGVTHDWFRRHTPEPDGEALAVWLRSVAAQHDLDYRDDWRTGQFTVDQAPASLRLDAGLRYLPMRYVPYGGRAVVPKWLSAPPERPRVALTLGLSATEYFNGYTFRPADIFEALADLEVEVVATIAESEQRRLGPVPGNVRVVAYTPLLALAPTCTAAIHHGGFGTLTTFALHAVPQLVLPYHFEGPLIAGKLAAQGAGLTLHSDRVTGELVREHLLRLLTAPVFTERARVLRDELTDLPAPNEVVPRLEQMAGLIPA